MMTEHIHDLAIEILKLTYNGNKQLLLQQAMLFDSFTAKRLLRLKFERAKELGLINQNELNDLVDQHNLIGF